MKLEILLKRVGLSAVFAFSFILASKLADASEASDANGLYEEIYQIKDLEALKAYLDTSDPQDARLVIRRLADVGKSRAIVVLEDLWMGGRTLQALEHKNTYDDPVARLMLAQQLLKIGPRDECATYIKSYADHNDWIVQSFAAEALVAVDDAEAVELLATIARSKHYFVAQAGLESLVQIAQRGKQSKAAILEIQKIRNDSFMMDRQLNYGIEGAYKDMGGDVSLTPENPPKDDLFVQSYNDDSFDEKIQPYLEIRDYEAAIDLLLPYAQQGNVRAQHVVGELYLALDKPIYKDAAKWLFKAVKKDYAPAKVSLANLYLSGRGVRKDTDEAVRLLLEAERQGDKDAEALLNRARQRGWWGLKAKERN